ncbi:LOW QUALITY PROTEIN: biotin carboxylase of acetyl-CoA carboxylase [Geomicrobium sp. JCM 19055]|nr:LOW QUALITY PROTEIN: biotin carboxylase of acetyl-CoA carboxylase [Geomicrobium sp. JCM 19055]
MFKKVLIANRGEIACRIIRTCKEMGIASVAVYSDADATSLHVKIADEAYHIGGSAAKDSYLNDQKIIEVAKESGAEAIHPGYGFLSENAEFSRLCKENDLVFVGPRPETIEAMGDKISAREKMEAAGVPVLPGNHSVASADEAVEVAATIGYPSMVKAAAGGGGIGMELVTNDDQLRKAYSSNQRRAKNYFGSGNLYLEKALLNPRHIEIQVIADSFGDAIHLGERDCSIQRRHQKVIEEAPAPALGDDVREAMRQAALKAVTSLQYVNAGTLEFLYEEGQFYFLEMNTRLQVEHPVTEAITGVDLVKEQLTVASGKGLSVRQEEVTFTGHSIECRVYAEDPVTFFHHLGRYRTFCFLETVRVDHSIETGTEVTPFYDPMIAKVIVHDLDRQKAIEKMKQTLLNTSIEGIKTNIPFLRRVLDQPDFINENMNTNFVQKHKETILQ